MDKTTNKELSDADYIHWAQRDQWSPTESIFLLRGLTPPDHEMSIQELSATVEDKDVEGVKSLLAMPGEYGDIWSSHPANWVRFAHERIRSDSNWIAIFSGSIPESLASIFDEEPDYNRFSGAMSHSHRMPLGELGDFALGIGARTLHAHLVERSDLLAAMAAILDLRQGNVEQLNTEIVDAAQFIVNYPRQQFMLDHRCEFWADWRNQHPDIVRWLAGKKTKAAAIDPEDQEAWVLRPVDGGMWEVGPCSAPKRIKHLKGLGDLVMALRLPEKDVLKDIFKIDPANAVARFGADAAIDDRAKAEVQRKISDLEESLEMARHEGIDDEIEECERDLARHQFYLKAGTRPGYKARSLAGGDTLKSAALCLRGRRKTVINHLTELGLNEMAQHIEKQWKIGDKGAVYSKSHPVTEWLLDP